MTGYEYPYQRELDSIVYDDAFQPEDLVQIRDELELDKEDVLVTSYPKSGGKCEIMNFQRANSQNATHSLMVLPL